MKTEFKADFLFVKNQDDKLNFNEADLVEFKPYGLSLNQETVGARPFMILKDESGEHVLPVGISQIEAGILLTQSQLQTQASSPHSFLGRLIESLDLKIERCVFVEISGHHQFVRLFMSGHPKYQSLKLRADEAVSLCAYLKVPFFATLNFVTKSKIMLSALPTEGENLLLQQMGLSPKKDYYH